MGSGEDEDVVDGWVWAYPEIYIQIPTTPKLPIAHLERHGHLVVLVQGLVEAFARVRFHLDVVRICQSQQRSQPDQQAQQGRHDRRGLEVVVMMGLKFDMPREL